MVLALLLLACSESDYSVKNVCVEDAGGFDIEEVSTLQDAAGYPGARDAIVLSFDDSNLGEGESWRVTGIDFLAMIPEEYFDSYDGGDKLVVDLWDGNRPSGASGDWHLEQAIRPAEFDWSEVTLPRDAYWAGLRGEFQQRRAWMHFDLSDLVPEEGMTSNRYTVSVGWYDSGLPTIGYSNFNLDCSKNWTDYGDGSWTLNSADGDGNDCSWPMMRVQVETRTLDDGACTGESVAI